MARNEWIKSISLLLLGIIIGHLLSPNPYVQTILQSVFALNVWGIPMGTIILIVAAIIMSILLCLNQRAINKQKLKEKPPLSEAKIDAIINKLGISQEDIRSVSEKNKDTTH